MSYFKKYIYNRIRRQSTSCKSLHLVVSGIRTFKYIKIIYYIRDDVGTYNINIPPFYDNIYFVM